jgi:uncharacterized protein YbjQ (UPF0145 family)
MKLIAVLTTVGSRDDEVIGKNGSMLMVSASGTAVRL